MNKFQSSFSYFLCVLLFLLTETTTLSCLRFALRRLFHSPTSSRDSSPLVVISTAHKTPLKEAHNRTLKMLCRRGTRETLFNSFSIPWNSARDYSRREVPAIGGQVEGRK